MATVKVKLRPSSVDGKPGTLYYLISHRHATRQLAIPLRLMPGQWDSRLERLSPSVENSMLLQSRIEYDLKLLRQIIVQYEQFMLPYTVDDIVRRFYTLEKETSVLQFMRGQINHLYRINRIGTARNYERALRSFADFLSDSDIPFSALDDRLVDCYNRFLVERGVVRNTISFYMRIWRAVYNKAVRQRLVEQHFPFQNVYTGIDKTRKRAVDEQIIARLHKLDLPEHSGLALARDLFIFSYCARGMAFVDMVYLRKSDLSNGMIRYTRRKTGQQLIIQVEPCIRRIIDRYGANDLPYIFPILVEDSPERCYQHYEKALNYYNRCLKKLSALLKLSVGLSFYVARHSWATAARHHRVPLAVISAGMGHASERTTQIYLGALENSVIDAANRSIIARLG